MLFKFEDLFVDKHVSIKILTRKTVLNNFLCLIFIFRGVLNGVTHGKVLRNEGSFLDLWGSTILVVLKFFIFFVYIFLFFKQLV